MKPNAVTFDVSVVGGAGNTAFAGFGDLAMTSVIIPSGNPTWDYSILDDGAYGVSGKTGNVGNTSIVEGQFILNGGTFYIANATVDGTYKVKLFLVPTHWGQP